MAVIIIYPDCIFIVEVISNIITLIIYEKIINKKYNIKIKISAIIITSLLSTIFIIFFEIKQYEIKIHEALFISIIAAFIEIFILQLSDNKYNKINKKIKYSILETPIILFCSITFAGNVYFLNEYIKINSILKILMVLLVSGAFIYIVLNFIKLRKSRILNEEILTVWISIDEITYTVKAIIDTGNNLYDVLTKEPVNILEENIIFGSVKKEDMLKSNPEKFKFIPYSSIGCKNGILMVLTADKMIIKRGSKKISYKCPEFGLVDQNLSDSGSWHLLLNSAFKS